MTADLLPLPYPQMPGNDYTANDMQKYALAAIEADRKKRGEPVARVNNEGFIVEVEGVSIAPGTLLYAAPQVDPERGEPLTEEERERLRGLGWEVKSCPFCGEEWADGKKRGEPVAWAFYTDGAMTTLTDTPMEDSVPLYATPPVDPEKRERAKKVLARLDDLIEQATKERSHFYVRKVATEAAALLREEYL
jgi:hypothetical protein